MWNVVIGGMNLLSRQPGPRNGLNLNLFVNQADYLYAMSPSAGFRVWSNLYTFVFLFRFLYRTMLCRARNATVSCRSGSPSVCDDSFIYSFISFSNMRYDAVRLSYQTIPCLFKDQLLVPLPTFYWLTYYVVNAGDLQTDSNITSSNFLCKFADDAYLIVGYSPLRKTSNLNLTVLSPVRSSLLIPMIPKGRRQHIARLTRGTPAHNALHSQVGLASGRSLGGDRRRRPGRPHARWTDQLAPQRHWICSCQPLETGHSTGPW